MSKETVFRITDKVIEEMNDWANRPLDGVYAAVFIDAIVRREALCYRVEVEDRAPRGAVSSCVGGRPAPLLRRSGVVEAGGSLVR